MTCLSDLCISPDLFFKVQEHIRRSTTVTGGLTTKLLIFKLYRDPDFPISLYISLVRPKLEYTCKLLISVYDFLLASGWPGTLASLPHLGLPSPRRLARRSVGHGRRGDYRCEYMYKSQTTFHNDSEVFA